MSFSKTLVAIMYDEFDRLGEDQVRAKIDRGEYVGNQRHHAKEWLSRFDAQRESERSARTDAYQRDQAAAASSAARSAALQAEYARKANRNAMIAIAISIASAIWSVISSLHKG